MIGYRILKKKYKQIFALLVFCIYCCSSLFSQGFSQNFRWNTGDRFTKVAYHDNSDRIVVMGTGFIDSLNRFGVYAAEFDTLGQFLNIKIMPSDSGFHGVLDDVQQCISSNDGGYLFVYTEFNNTNAIVSKLDRHLNVEWQHNLGSIEKGAFLRNLIETDTSVLVFGYYQRHDFDIDLYLANVSKEGQFLWDWRHTEPNTQFSATMFENNDYKYICSEFYLTTPWVYPLDLNPGEKRPIKNVIFKLEDSASLTKVLDGDEFTDWGEFSYVVPFGEGYYALAAPHVADYVHNSWLYDVALVYLNENFEVQWFKILDNFEDYGKYAFKLLRTQDDHLLMVGYRGLAGWLVKMDLEGNIIWDIKPDNKLIANLPDSVISDDILTDIIELPSGNIIAVGANHIYNPIKRIFGWMMKITPDGCYETICLSTNVEDLHQRDNTAPVLYPNPSDGMFYIKDWANSQFKNIRLQVYNLQGQLIQSRLLDTNSFQIDHPGIYFARCTSGQHLVFEEKIVVH